MIHSLPGFWRRVGLFIPYQGFGGGLDDAFPTRGFFLLVAAVLAEIARAYQIHFLGQDQSTVAQRAETTVTECSLTSCFRARFLIDFCIMPGRYSQLPPTSLGQSCDAF